MTHRDGFLSEFDPLPGGVALPARVLADYEVDSCLAYQSAERLILLLRRKSDDKLIVLKAATAGKVKCPQKVRQYFGQKLFKQSKGLVVCELQAASPLALS